MDFIKASWAKTEHKFRGVLISITIQASNTNKYEYKVFYNYNFLTLYFQL